MTSYKTDIAVVQPIYTNIIISGDVVLEPMYQDKNIFNHILKKCKEKYNNRVKDLEGELIVIINILSIDHINISNKILRNNNDGASRYYVNMNCIIFKPQVTQNLNCKICSMNTDFIEAQYTIHSSPVKFLIIIEDSTINNEKFNLGSDNSLIHRETGKLVETNDIIVVNVDSILQNMVDIVIFAKLLDLM
jgi:DNA-directed RNA polymerase subunit E'/Rpb7